MDDIRRINHSNRLKRRANFSVFVKFITKHWLKIFILAIVIFIIFFPEISGSVVGEWFNKLVSAFIKNLTF